MKSRLLTQLTSVAILLAAIACTSSSSSSDSPAAPSVTTPPPTPNRAPIVDTVTASPPVGLQGSTTVTFSANASDADGDPLQYLWAFGDGGTASGQIVSHLYQAGGTMTVSVAVRDATATTTKETPFTSVSLSGIWWSPDACGIAGSGTVPCAYEQGNYLTLTHTGASVTGNQQVFTLNSTPGGQGGVFYNVNPLSGSVDTLPPRIRLNVTGVNASGGAVPLCYILDANADITALAGGIASGVCGGSGAVGTRNPFVRTTTVPHP